MNRRNTKQKELILNVVRSLLHPTAEAVLQEVQRIEPSIGRATVFRNLALLSESNELLRLNFAGDSNRYDWNLTDHNHFICERCGKIIDLPATPLPEPDLEEGFSVRMKSVNFYGLCRDCMKSNSEA